MTFIDWTDGAAQITPHFTVREACLLPTWGILHNPLPAQRANLTKLCEFLETVRAQLNAPINVHCMIRPKVTNAPGTAYNKQDYNKLVGGAPASAHTLGLACDFDVPGQACDDVRALLLPFLETWNCRMENKPGSNWIHMDLNPPNPNRYFIP